MEQHFNNKRTISLSAMFSILIASLLLVSSCGEQDRQVQYELVSNASGNSIIIKGLDASYLEYSPARDNLPANLYFVNPEFLGRVFTEVSVEGEAILMDHRITVSFTRDDDEGGTVFGASVRFVVDLEQQQVAERVFTPWEEYEIDLADDEMIFIGTKLSEIIQGAEAYFAENTR